MSWKTIRVAARVALVGLAIILAFGSAPNVRLATSGHALVEATPPDPIFLPIISKHSRPNFIIIISDDQRYDTMDYMPLTQARLFDRGTTFARAYVTTPVCCPSRSSILTGMYAHNHFAYDNYSPLDKPTLVHYLHAAGYYTGIVGKYLNSWDGSDRPEFDEWVVFAGHGSAQRYFDPLLNVNGEWVQHYGYFTHLLRDYALDFLDRARRQEAPYLLIFAPNAPHEPATPAPGDEDLYPDLPVYRPPSFMEEDLTDKPVYLQNRPPVSPDHVDWLRRRQVQALRSLDSAVSVLLDRIEQDDNTVVIYLSDNGVYWGEHRLDGKLYPYPEASHIPFAIRYARLVPQPRVEWRLVANIDIAPTVYELAGLPIPGDVDGRSLVPLLRQQGVEWRDALVIEGWGYYAYMALQTERYLYVETEGDIGELYDSRSDPYQLQNEFFNPTYATVVAELHSTLLGYRSGIQRAPGWRLLPFLMGALGLDD